MDHAGTDAHSSALQIEIADLPVVPREIDHQAFPNRAAHQPGARAPWNNGNARLRRRFDYRAGLPRAFGKSYGDRLDLVNRSVCRIKLAGKVVEGHLTVRGCKEGLLLGGRHRTSPA